MDKGDYRARIKEFERQGLSTPQAKLLAALSPLNKEFTTKDLTTITGFGKSWINVLANQLIGYGVIASRTLEHSTGGRREFAYWRVAAAADIKLKMGLESKGASLSKLVESGSNHLTDEDWAAAGLTPAEIGLLKILLDWPIGKWISSVPITTKLGITQATISGHMKPFKEMGWVESGPGGYRRVKTFDEIKQSLAEEAESND